jgi:hypothetical protein
LPCCPSPPPLLTCCHLLFQYGHCGDVNVVNLSGNVIDTIVVSFKDGRLPSPLPQPSPSPSNRRHRHHIYRCRCCHCHPCCSCCPCSCRCRHCHHCHHCHHRCHDCRFSTAAFNRLLIVPTANTVADAAMTAIFSAAAFKRLLIAPTAIDVAPIFLLPLPPCRRHCRQCRRHHHCRCCRRCHLRCCRKHYCHCHCHIHCHCCRQQWQRKHCHKVGLVVGCSVELRGLKDLRNCSIFEKILQRQFQKSTNIVVSTEESNTS